MKTKLLALFVAAVLVGCASVPAPNLEQNTLLTGKFLVNWNTKGKMSGANGVYKFGIKIYFQDIVTGKTIIASTQKGGWFVTNKLDGIGYRIQKFFLEKQEDNTIYQMTLSGPFDIIIEEGKVNNLGVIQIDVENEGYSVKVVDYDVVKFDFENEFPNSEWNSYEWENTELYR